MQEILKVLNESGFTKGFEKAMNSGLKMLDMSTEEDKVEEAGALCLMTYLNKNRDEFTKICKEIIKAMDVKIDKSYDVTLEEKIKMIKAITELLDLI